MKKLAITIATTLLGVVALLPAAPAAAAQSGLYCEYSGPGVARAGGHLKVENDVNGRQKATLYVYDSAGGRQWNWKIYHNGDVSALGTRWGSFTEVKPMVNFVGTDSYWAVVRNESGTVYCDARVSL